jgi:hypothetical protein
MNYPDIELPRIGTLRYDKEYEWYEGQIKIQQLEIPVRLSTDEEGKVAFVCERVTNLSGTIGSQNLTVYVDRSK